MPEAHGYHMTPEEERLEAENIRFHVEINNRSYMAFHQVQAKVDPEKTYQVSDGTTKRVLSGTDLLRNAHQSARTHSCTYIQAIEEVAKEFRQHNQELWATHTDHITGETLVEGHGQDPWDTGRFTETEATPAQLRQSPLSAPEIAELANDILRTTREGQEPHEPEPYAVARTVMLECLTQRVATLTKEQAGNPFHMRVPRLRAKLAFDVAYHRERIRLAGIDLADHPEFQTTQTFFELGWPPPDHGQMADYIIETLKQQGAVD